MRKLIYSIALVIALLPVIALAATPSITLGLLTPNYTYNIPANNYTKGGETVTLNVTLDWSGGATPDPVVNATFYYGTSTLTKTLGNHTATSFYNSTAMPSTSGTGNITIWAYNDSTKASIATYVIYNFGIDAVAPSIGTPSEVNQTWKTRTGDSKNITVTITDAVAISNCTVDFISKPTGTNIANTTMEFMYSSSTSNMLNYTFKPNVTGTHTYRITCYDNVTNTNSSNYKIIFKMRESEVPLEIIEREREITIPVIDIPGLPEGIPGPFEAILEPFRAIFSGITGFFTTIRNLLPF